MRPLQSLTLEAMIDLLSTTFRQVPDPRRPDRVDYSVHDTLLSGFAMMFFQHPSLLEFQRKMQQRRGRGNLETIFGVTEVPSDTQMRQILDGVPTELLRLLLPALFEKIRRAGWAQEFTSSVPSGEHHGIYYTLSNSRRAIKPSNRLAIQIAFSSASMRQCVSYGNHLLSTQNRHPTAATSVKSACKTVIATSLRR